MSRINNQSFFSRELSGEQWRLGHGGVINGLAVWPHDNSLHKAVVTSPEWAVAESRFFGWDGECGPLNPIENPCVKLLTRYRMRYLSGWCVNVAEKLAIFTGVFTVCGSGFSGLRSRCGKIYMEVCYTGYHGYISGKWVVIVDSCGCSWYWKCASSLCWQCISISCCCCCLIRDENWWFFEVKLMWVLLKGQDVV